MRLISLPECSLCWGFEVYSELAHCVAPEKHLFLVSTTHFHLNWNWHSPQKIYVDFYCCFLSSAEGSSYVLRATEYLVVYTN